MRYEEEELQNIRYWKAVFSGIGSVGSILASIASWQHQAGLPAVSPIDWESVSGNVINSAEVRKEVIRDGRRIIETSIISLVEYVLNGAKHTIKATRNPSSQLLVGELVPVFIEKGNPANASLEAYQPLDTRPLWKGVAIAFGAGALFFGYFAFSSYREWKKNEETKK